MDTLRPALARRGHPTRQSVHPSGSQLPAVSGGDTVTADAWVLVLPDGEWVVWEEQPTLEHLQEAVGGLVTFTIAANGQLAAWCNDEAILLRLELNVPVSRAGR